MVSDVQVCNMALGRISAQPIADLITDKTKSATICRTFYEPIRDALLREHPWGFAVKRQSLAIASVENLTTHEFVYQLPTSPRCVKILEVLSSALLPSVFPYDREGDYLFTSEPSPVLRFTAQVSDPTKFDALFLDALAWRLASEIIGPMTGESSAEPWAKYERVIVRAWGSDEQEKIEKAVSSPRWVDERHGLDG